jgi:hypothetical protein
MTFEYFSAGWDGFRLASIGRITVTATDPYNDHAHHLTKAPSAPGLSRVRHVALTDDGASVALVVQAISEMLPETESRRVSTNK